MSGHGRRVPAAGDHALGGEVENIQRRRRDVPDQRQVNTALRAADSTAHQSLRFRAIVSQFGDFEVFRERCLRARQVQCSSRRQHRVANLFGIQPPRTVSPGQPVRGVGRHVGRRGLRCELIRARQHQCAHQLLDRPALANESLSQVIQQLRMRRRIAGDSKVINAEDQPLTEQVLPNPIDHHARRQRVLFAGQPLSQFQSAALIRIHGRRIRDRDRAEEPPCHDRAKLLGFATHTNFGVADGLGIARSEGDRPLHGRIAEREHVRLQLRDFLARDHILLPSV